jgi:hypothetical protein
MAASGLCAAASREGHREGSGTCPVCRTLAHFSGALLETKATSLAPLIAERAPAVVSGLRYGSRTISAAGPRGPPVFFSPALS